MIKKLVGSCRRDGRPGGPLMHQLHCQATDPEICFCAGISPSFAPSSTIVTGLDVFFLHGRMTADQWPLPLISLPVRKSVSKTNG
jgi:hypothetical protein